MTLPRTSTALATAALVLSTAACGGGGGSAAPAGSSSAAPSTSAPAAAAPAPSSASPSAAAITKQSAQAAADKINLQAADLPGFSAAPPENTDSKELEKLENDLAKCLGASTEDPLQEIASDDFTKGSELPVLVVSSGVSFVDDPERVRQDLAALEGDKARDCLAKFTKKTFTQAAGGAGVTFSDPEVEELSPAGAAGVETFGFTVTSKAQAQGESVPFTLTLLGAGKQRTETSLFMLGVGTEVPAGQRDALFAKLVERTSASAL